MTNIRTTFFIDNDDEDIVCACSLPPPAARHVISLARCPDFTGPISLTFQLGCWGQMLLLLNT